MVSHPPKVLEAQAKYKFSSYFCNMLMFDSGRNKRGFWPRELGKRMKTKRNTPLLGGFKKRKVIEMYMQYTFLCVLFLCILIFAITERNEV